MHIKCVELLSYNYHSMFRQEKCCCGSHELYEGCKATSDTSSVPSSCPIESSLACSPTVIP